MVNEGRCDLGYEEGRHYGRTAKWEGTAGLEDDTTGTEECTTRTTAGTTMNVGRHDLKDEEVKSPP